MVTIRPLEHVPHCYTSNDGAVIGGMILQALDAGEDVTVSFEGVDSVPSSFVNSAFLDLLDHYDYETLKQRLKITHSTRQINHMIKSRFESAIRRPEAAPSS
jgi:hypothetical protein